MNEFEWDGNESSCSCDCGFDIPKGGTLDELNVKNIAGIANKIYPVGSIYMSTNATNPGDIFGGTWEPIENKFLVGVGSDFKSGTVKDNGVSVDVNVAIPNHRHLTPIVTSGEYLGVWTDGSKTNVTETNRYVAPGGAVSSSATASTYYTAKDGACETTVTVPPTLPPYMAVYMWYRVE